MSNKVITPLRDMILCKNVTLENIAPLNVTLASRKLLDYLIWKASSKMTEGATEIEFEVTADEYFNFANSQKGGDEYRRFYDHIYELRKTFVNFTVLRAGKELRNSAPLISNAVMITDQKTKKIEKVVFTINTKVMFLFRWMANNIYQDIEITQQFRSPIAYHLYLLIQAKMAYKRESTVFELNDLRAQLHVNAKMTNSKFTCFFEKAVEEVCKTSGYDFDVDYVKAGRQVKQVELINNAVRNKRLKEKYTEKMATSIDLFEKLLNK